MRITLAVKDLFHSTSRLKSHVISSALIFAAYIFISGITKSTIEFNLAVDEEPAIYTLSYFQMFMNYTNFIQILSAVACIAIPILICVDIISSKRKDIGIIKAIGTDYKSMYSFYIYQLYIFVIISFGLGVLISGVIYLVALSILQAVGIEVKMYWATFESLIILLASLFGVWAVNGFQIRKIGRARYNDTQHSTEIRGTDYIKPNRLVKWLEKRSISMRLALRQIRRNKYEIWRSIAIMGFVTAILFTSLFSFLTTNTTVEGYLKETQSENMLIIGHKNVTDAYEIGLRRFGDPGLGDSHFSDMGQFNNSQFRIPENLINHFKSDECSNFVEGLESRFLSYYYLHEKPGYLVDENNQLNGSVILWKNVSRYAPVIGMDFNTTFSKWQLNGTIPEMNNHALIGDSLSSIMFNTTLKQGFSFYDESANRTISYVNRGIVIDPFNRGYVVYVPLAGLQDYLDSEKFTNILLLKWKGETIPLDTVREAVLNLCGPDFNVVDMNPILNDNIKSLYRIQLVPVMVIGILVILVFIVANGFESAKIQDYMRDYEIIRAIGTPYSILKSTIYRSKMLLFLLGSLVGFVFSMYFTFFGFLHGGRFPDPLIPVLSLFVVWIMYAITSGFDSRRVSNTISKDRFTHFK